MSRWLLLSLVPIGLFFLAALYFGQSRLIYFPRSYPPDSGHFSTVEKVTYRSGKSEQVAFLYPREGAAPPERLWWLFGGNGSTALDWVPLLEGERFPEGTRFVLVDYPGYGLCQGKTSPEAIATSIKNLYLRLCHDWSMEPEELARRSGALGHSLGASIALKTAAEYEMPEVVAIAPFTSMEDMAKRQIGFLHPLLRHHYDNRESVRRLIEREEPARIHLFHGDRDELIPHAMSEELLEIAGKERANLRTAQGYDHSGVVAGVRREWSRILQAR